MTARAHQQFQSHRNYLRAYSCLCGCEGRGGLKDNYLETTARRVVDSPVYRTTQRGSNTEGVNEALVNAWGTELLLAASGLFPDRLVAISNNWGVVQLYYAAFHAAQALTAAVGGTRPSNHEAMRKQYLDLWTKPRGARDLLPWSLAFGKNGPANAPSGRVVEDWINPLTACDCSTCWSLAFQSMRTSRKDGVDDRIEERRKEIRRERKARWEARQKARLAAGQTPLKRPKWTRPNLSAEEKRATTASVRDYSMLDYLFRLRLKANYEDALMFTEGPPDDAVSVAVHEDLVRIAASTLLAHELRIRQLVGRPVLTQWIEDWLESNSIPTKRPLGLAARSSLLT